jgi:hypothetical protein
MKKNLITVLKKLLAAFGGEDTNSNNAVEIVDKIADSVELENYATKDELQNTFNGRKVDAIYKEYNSASQGDIIIGVT